MAVCIKLGAEGLTDEFVVFLRSILGLPVILVLFLIWPRECFYIRKPKAHIIRGTLIFIAVFMFIYTITRLPVANSVVIQHMAPLFMPFFALLLIGEKITLRHIILLILGFFAVLIINDPSMESFISYVVLIGIASACISSFTSVYSKQIMDNDHPCALTLSFTACLIFFSSLWVLLTGGWQIPSLETCLYVMLAATFANLAHLWSFLALKEVNSSYFAMLVCMSIPFGVIGGVVFLDEYPNILSLAGIVFLLGLIIVSSILEMKSNKNISSNK